MPEMCGRAALYFDPYNIPEISSIMKTMLDNKKFRKEMSELSLNRAKKFSWKKTAMKTHKIFEEVYTFEA